MPPKRKNQRKGSTSVGHPSAAVKEGLLASSTLQSVLGDLFGSLRKDCADLLRRECEERKERTREKAERLWADGFPSNENYERDAFGEMDDFIADLETSSCGPSSEAPVPLKTRPQSMKVSKKKSIKAEVLMEEEETGPTTSSISTLVVEQVEEVATFSAEELTPRVARIGRSASQPKTQQRGPQVNSEMEAETPEDENDVDMEEQEIPKTVRRLEQLHIREVKDEVEDDGYGVGQTPMQLLAANRVQSTPVRDTKERQVKSIARKNLLSKVRDSPLTRLQSPRVVVPTSPAKVLVPVTSTVKKLVPVAPPQDMTKKMDHACDLKGRLLMERTEKLKKEREEKQRMAKERRDKKEREAREKQEKKQAQVAKVAEIVKQNTQPPTPPRSRIQSPSRYMLPKTPIRNRLLDVDQDEEVVTPGRRAAKQSRIVALEGEDLNVATSVLSPSRTGQNIRRKSGRNKKGSPPVLQTFSSEGTPGSSTAVRTKKKLGGKDEKSVEAKRERARKKKEAEDTERQRLMAEQEMYLAQMTKREDEQRAEREHIEAERIAAEKVAAEEAERRRVEEAKERRRQEVEEARMEEERRVENARRRKEEEARIMKEEAMRIKQEKEVEQREYEAAKQKQAASTATSSSYEMTPPRVYVAKSTTDYGLDDLNSDDETDQEDEPRKEVPDWADFKLVRRACRAHRSEPPFDVANFFGFIPKPNLLDIFGSKLTRIKKRGSSAVWNSPLSAPAQKKTTLRQIPKK